ncbi:MAG: hypothetical protein HYY23_02130 [Verrucomicrobia bacterium]|nr:hypothetical protein [Verrucomicrobiota bacterium]
MKPQMDDHGTRLRRRSGFVVAKARGRVRSPFLLRTYRIWLALVCSVALAGCAAPKPGGSPQSRSNQTRIDELNVLAMPVPLNLDALPGVDGFAIQVYAVDRQKPKTQPIREGTLDVLMYDGLLKQVTPDESRCRHVWNFGADQLKALAAETAIGVSYRFTLNWGADKPHDDKITLIVRYRPVQGEAVYAPPSSIAIPGD